MLTSSSLSNDRRFLQVCYVTGAPLQLASRLNGFFLFFCANLLRKRIRGLKQKLIFLVKFGKASRPTTKIVKWDQFFSWNSWDRGPITQHLIIRVVCVCMCAVFFCLLFSWTTQKKTSLLSSVVRPRPSLKPRPLLSFACRTFSTFPVYRSSAGGSRTERSNQGRAQFLPPFFMFYFARVTRITKVL